MNRFERTIELLDAERTKVIDELRVGKNEVLLSKKKELDDAIKCLAWASQNEINTSALIVVLPETGESFLEYRILDDHDSGDRETWTELVDEENYPITATPGDLLILNSELTRQPGRSPQLPSSLGQSGDD